MPNTNIEPSPKNLGRQITIEYAQCDNTILQNEKAVQTAMENAAVASGATVVTSSFHSFEPHGISGVVIISQSHFTIHAWPEYQYAAVDIFTCDSKMNVDRAIEEIKISLQAGHHVISSDLQRGCPAPPVMDKHTDDEIQVRIIDSASRKEMIALYKDADWWESPADGNLNFLDKVVTDSFLFAGAFCRGKLIGMGRALSDGVSDAYIQDVVVFRSFRGKGVGKKLIQTLVKGLQANKIDWIGLIGEPGTAPFYEPLGFSILKDYIPMKLNKLPNNS